MAYFQIRTSVLVTTGVRPRTRTNPAIPDGATLGTATVGTMGVDVTVTTPTMDVSIIRGGGGQHNRLSGHFTFVFVGVFFFLFSFYYFHSFFSCFFSSFFSSFFFFLSFFLFLFFFFFLGGEGCRGIFVATVCVTFGTRCRFLLPFL